MQIIQKATTVVVAVQRIIAVKKRIPLAGCINNGGLSIFWGIHPVVCVPDDITIWNFHFHF